jgi:hypothetical protein
VAEQPMTEQEPTAVTALPPYAATSIKFREAVYTHPEIVWVSVDDTVEGGELTVRVAGMQPGSQLRVQGGEGVHSWTALLTCGPDRLFALTEVAARPADGPADPPEVVG